MERLPGFRDFYPEPLPTRDLWSSDARRHLFETWRRVAGRYGFREYDGPPLEPLELFTTKSGSEIVGQLYNFKDKGDREVALRPEMTPTLARMAAAHERNYRKPIKWFAIPQLFRYERQQKGRLREHFQFNADIIGESSPEADAELIALLIDSLRALGLTAEDFRIRLSSREAWQHFYASAHADPTREYEFFQVVDKLERETPEHTDAKLRALGLSLERVQEVIAASRPTDHLQRILDNLAARGLTDFVALDYRVIRGLAYYTGTVFEAFDRKGEFRAIAGGGRYDNLIKLLSGGKSDMPALGFGMGDVVLTELLNKRGLLSETAVGPMVYCLIEEESWRPASLGLVQKLRDAGLACEFALTPMKSDKQFKRAQELGVRFTIRLEGAPDRVKLRDLKERRDETLEAGQAIEVIQRATR
ncbi:MAG: histidine--tRNA ligase [Verrucomicrobia bacterium]|jgi:histidyl-tRNA synthetase|nr:histidine--tRNA ligase [Verrucomicrobiota bacterium]